MDWDQLELNPKVIAAVKKAQINSAREVLNLSVPDLQRLTKLSSLDVQRLLKTVALALRRNTVVTALHMYQQREKFPAQHRKLSLGCSVLDGLLGGGLPLAGITELAGRSSAGKTQIGMQLCLSVQYPPLYGGLGAGAVYICTEDVFPNKRLQQLIAQQQKLRTDIPGEVIERMKFGNNIFIEHAADLETLQDCVGKRVPILLARGMARLVVVDSVAALFRCEFGARDSVGRARCLQSLGAKLHQLSAQFDSPVLCINQVTDILDERETAHSNFGLEEEAVTPALGLTWSNQLLMRMMVHRLPAGGEPTETAGTSAPGPVVRALRVVFAPHLPPAFCYFTVNAEGVKGLKEVPSGTEVASGPPVLQKAPYQEARLLQDGPAQVRGARPATPPSAAPEPQPPSG
ncbi:DNA repair protein XRCC3 [Ornithorhynchus anatinus]|uniref:DNA repair protein n=1 Tax=Ornithorhynchus anatinus TaxID=9258 RepID=F6RD96_ORNAN|nr:DNA repair protein XRCC3 [Ornithorhynchus anatinus]XP_039768012.1 DNA repair protein XRCC3 [Ornithorhynchus anatinus]